MGTDQLPVFQYSNGMLFVPPKSFSFTEMKLGTEKLEEKKDKKKKEKKKERKKKIYICLKLLPRVYPNSKHT